VYEKETASFRASLALCIWPWVMHRVLSCRCWPYGLRLRMLTSPPTRGCGDVNLRCAQPHSVRIYGHLVADLVGQARGRNLLPAPPSSSSDPPTGRTWHLRLGYPSSCSSGLLSALDAALLGGAVLCASLAVLGLH
jgi:hypothetical protein